MENNNVKCLLEPGDAVQLNKVWGGKLGGKKGKVISVRSYRNCESGFLVATDITDKELDANWFKKITPLPTKH